MNSINAPNTEQSELLVACDERASESLRSTPHLALAADIG